MKSLLDYYVPFFIVVFATLIIYGLLNLVIHIDYFKDRQEGMTIKESSKGSMDNEPEPVDCKSFCDAWEEDMETFKDYKGLKYKVDKIIPEKIKKLESKLKNIMSKK